MVRLADGARVLRESDRPLPFGNRKNGAAIVSTAAPFYMCEDVLPAIALAAAGTGTTTKSTTTAAGARLLGTRFIHG